MNEPPGARARVALTGLTVAEYFRDQEGQDVLFFVDNIFRWGQVTVVRERRGGEVMGGRKWKARGKGYDRRKRRGIGRLVGCSLLITSSGEVWQGKGEGEKKWSGTLCILSSLSPLSLHILSHLSLLTTLSLSYSINSFHYFMYLIIFFFSPSHFLSSLFPLPSHSLPSLSHLPPLTLNFPWQVHTGWFWGVCLAGSHSLSCGIPTNSGYWHGEYAGEDHHHY